jgi:hypothetical protein
VSRDRARRAAVRVAGVVGVLALATAVTFASHSATTAGVTGFLAKYSPSRLAAGRVWTVPTSAFLLGHPHMLGPTSAMLALVFLPYALWCGIGRAGITAMSGHVVATLAVAAVVLPGSWLGWTTGTTIAHTLDYGSSAALAACAGGLAVLIGRRRPVACPVAGPVTGTVLLALVAGFFVFHLLSVPKLDANVADVEHLVALFTGAAVEGSLVMRRSRRQPVAAHLAGPVTGMIA